MFNKKNSKTESKAFKSRLVNKKEWWFVLQKCENCKTAFSWSKIYKSVWAYKSIVCDKCGKEHKITIPGRFTFVSLTILPTLIFSDFLSPFENILMTIIVGTTILLFGSLFTPFLVKYKERV